MPNIFDYLRWRGDLTLSADPFNEVDNLVLAELAYTQFGGIVPGDGTGVPLREVRDEFFTLNSRAEIERSDDVLIRTALLMDGMVTGDRFGDILMSDYVNLHTSRSAARIVQ